MKSQNDVMAAEGRGVELAYRNDSVVHSGSMRAIGVDRRRFRESDGQALSDVLKDLIWITIEQVAEHGTRS